MKKIKLTSTLYYGKGPSDYYASGAVLSADHFPEAVFGQHPERTMAGLVGDGQATVVDEPKTPETAAPPKKTDPAPGGKK